MLQWQVEGIASWLALMFQCSCTTQTWGGGAQRRDFHPFSCQVDFANALRLEAKTQALKLRATDSRTAQELIAK